MRIAEIHVTFPDAAVAAQVTKTIISERLAACANSSVITSEYWWEGEVENQTEVAVVFKTRRSLVEQVTARLRELHPYEVPSIIGHDVSHVNDEYAQWVHDSTTHG